MGKIIITIIAVIAIFILIGANLAFSQETIDPGLQRKLEDIYKQLDFLKALYNNGVFTVQGTAVFKSSMNITGVTVTTSTYSGTAGDVFFTSDYTMRIVTATDAGANIKIGAQ